MSARSQRVAFARGITVFYCRACHALFGKTLSVMIGEADAAGRWHGAAGAAFVDRLLRDPGHCAKQLVHYRRARRLPAPDIARGGERRAGRGWTFAED